MEIIFRLLKNDAFFPQEISRTSQTYRRQNHSACPACCAFLSRHARLPWHAQNMCGVTIVGTVLNTLKSSKSSQNMPSDGDVNSTEKTQCSKKKVLWLLHLCAMYFYCRNWKYTTENSLKSGSNGDKYGMLTKR